MPVDLVVFDWDGTLVDSTARIADCLHRAALDCGLPVLSPARYRSIIGLGLPEALAALYPQADADLRQQLRAHYARHYIALGEAEPCPPYAGAPELLDALQARGIRLAVATGKNRPGLARAFAQTGWASRFASSRTADETQSKPHPRMLQEILAEQRVSPRRALMVGDTGFDLEMAARAGVPSVGVTHGAHGEDELRRHAPVRLVDGLLQLLDVLDEDLPRWRAAHMPTEEFPT